jgi:hypothetical protein
MTFRRLVLRAVLPSAVHPGPQWKLRQEKNVLDAGFVGLTIGAFAVLALIVRGVERL